MQINWGYGREILTGFYGKVDSSSFKHFAEEDLKTPPGLLNNANRTEL